MKNLFFAVALLTGLSTNIVNAQNLQTITPIETIQPNTLDEFIEIESSELPQAIVAAVAEAYGTCVKQAFVSMSEEGLIYKLVLTAEDIEETVVFLNEKGEWLM